jgi:uncharacterized protein involved in copper resistance
MNRFFKTLMIWMLALALPAQALGSVIKLSCGPTHHANTSMNASMDASIKIAAPQHANHGMEHHAAYHHDVAGDAVQGDASNDSSDAPVKFESATCSACATCCAGAAGVHAHLNWAPSHRNSFVPVTPPATSFTGHVPAGLERPPRSDFI